MKIILSRKGFDSAIGGVASPILDGRLFSLPIPEDDLTRSRVNMRYSDLRSRIGSVEIASAISDLTGGRHNGRTVVHLDPDLDSANCARKNGWKGLFGQVGPAQSHLRHIEEVDLFLFFGWFREVQVTGGRLTYRRGAPDQHVIFGYLQVGEIWHLGARPECSKHRNWATYHPHFARTETNNTLYVAADTLSFAPKLPGFGLFRQLKQDLVLSYPGDEKRRRSYWRLPICFAPKHGTMPLTYHGNLARWECRATSVRLRTVGRGQEFIADTAAYPEIGKWARSLVRHNASSRAAAAGQG